MDNRSDICSLIQKLNINDDSIIVNQKLKDLCMRTDFQQFVREPHMKDTFASFNTLALNDDNFAINLAFLFSSRTFDHVVENGSAVRAEMLNTLEKNYKNAETLKSVNIKQFYNSLTMLGEYYNRSRIENGPIGVLGCALFELLAKQLESDTANSMKDSTFAVDEEFAKLILTQVSLNGSLAQQQQSKEIDFLLFAIRKCLIEVSQLSSTVKALFLMTLDLYYSKFTSIGKQLETMYSKFLVTNESEISTSIDQTPNITSKISINNLSQLRNELSGLGIVGNKQEIRINTEYIGRPLKASERLKFAQKKSLSHSDRQNEEKEILKTNLFKREINERTEQKDVVETKDLSKTFLIGKRNDNYEQVDVIQPSERKERKDDQAYFLVKPQNARQRLKTIESQPKIGDWYDEVENNAIDSKAAYHFKCSSESMSRSRNGCSGNSSSATSPNEIQRGNLINSSFRSIRSDYSTRSMDRVGNQKYDYRGHDNRRNSYNQSNYNQSKNYNNFPKNRNQSRHGQNIQGYRQQYIDKGNYQDRKNDNRASNSQNIGDRYNTNNSQLHRSFPPKTYGNRNRRRSYQHDDRQLSTKFTESQEWN